ncbi:MAG: hypothetical protein HY646_05920 [Acidobacteria bacterium]|nr:hypothetical protein [Acidobacteriota bacterium]
MQTCNAGRDRGLGRLRCAFILFSVLVICKPSAAQNETRRQSPYGCPDTVAQGVIREIEPRDAFTFCIDAELKKRAGDYLAERSYVRAIELDKTEPAYELFFADYLRLFRGPQRPLFDEAEEHYLESLRKLMALEQEGRLEEFDKDTKARTERGLVVLYERDGLPLLFRSVPAGTGSISVPVVFLSSVNTYTSEPRALDSASEVRDFTAEAMFSSSRERLGRELSRAELQAIIRKKPQSETSERIRFRYRNFPVIDLIGKYRGIENAQITNFYAPTKTNTVRLQTVGIAVEKPVKVSPVFDFFIRSSFERVRRRGLIEFLPDNDETVNQFENTAAVTRFLGPDKLTIDATHVWQRIHPQVSQPPERKRQIFAWRLTYQVFRPLGFLQDVFNRRFETRGIHLSAGALRDREQFGSVDIIRQDSFAEIAAKGIGRFDLSIQPTIFKARVVPNRSLGHSQYRTNVAVLWRVLDEEKEPGLPSSRFGGFYPAFLHVVFPFRHDVSVDGPDYFENFRFATQLDAKLFRTEDRRLTILISAQFAHQRFYRLDQNLNSFTANLSLGF